MKRKTEPFDLLIGLLLIQNLMERRSEAFFQPFGLTSAQFNILNLLAQHDGRMNQTALVDLLLVGKSSISIVLNRLVRDQLVKREAHPKDRRQVVVTLTTKGGSVWRKVSGKYEVIVKKIFGALPLGRRSQFLDDLQTLHHAFSAEDFPAESIKEWSAHFPTNSR